MESKLVRLLAFNRLASRYSQREHNLMGEHGRLLELLPGEFSATNSFRLLESPQAAVDMVAQLQQHAFGLGFALQDPEVLPLGILCKSRNHWSFQLQGCVRV